MLVRFVGGARGVYAISQVATGEENGLALRIYGDRAGLLWHQEEPNSLDLLPIAGPRQRLTRGGMGLGGATAWATRLPPGHPEGFIEGFANLYRSVGRAIRGGKGEAAMDGGFPDHTDGLLGMRFVEGTVESAATGGWVALAADSAAAEQPGMHR